MDAATFQEKVFGNGAGSLSEAKSGVRAVCVCVRGR